MCRVPFAERETKPHALLYYAYTNCPGGGVKGQPESERGVRVFALIHMQKMPITNTHAHTHSLGWEAKMFAVNKNDEIQRFGVFARVCTPRHPHCAAASAKPRCWHFGRFNIAITHTRGHHAAHRHAHARRTQSKTHTHTIRAHMCVICVLCSIITFNRVRESRTFCVHKSPCVSVCVCV